MILLTPLLTFDTILILSCIVITKGFSYGDKDHQYNADQVDQLHKTNLQIEVVKMQIIL